MRFVPGLLLVLLVACGDAAGPVPIEEFDVSTSLAASRATLVTQGGRWDGCQVTWTFRANDPRPTIYYSVGPGVTSDDDTWWYNGTFRGSVDVSLFVPDGRQTDYKLWRAEGTTEVWRKESGLRLISC